MLKDNAADFVVLGEQLASAQMLWILHGEKTDQRGKEILNAEGQGELRGEFTEILGLAKRLGLPTSMKLIGRRLGYDNNLPETEDEFRVIVEVLKDELSSKLFMFVPNERAAFWENDDLLSDEAKAAFPSAAAELRSAGNAYAAALYEGSVFYSMRAVEHGLLALAEDVGVNCDAQNWQNIINEIQAAIEGMRKNGIPGLS